MNSNQINPQHLPVTLRYLLKDLINDIVVDPYNRCFSWSDDQKSQLIDSILRGLYVPELQVDLQNNLIDGQHRLATLTDFIQDRFVFTDVDVNKNRRKRKYSEFTQEEKNQFENYTISLAKYSLPTEYLRKLQFQRVNQGASFKAYDRNWMLLDSNLFVSFRYILDHIDTDFLDFVKLPQDIKLIYECTPVKFTEINTRVVSHRKNLTLAVPFLMAAVQGKVDKNCLCAIHGKKKLLNKSFTEQEHIDAVSRINVFTNFVKGFKKYYEKIRQFNQLASLIMHALFENKSDLMSSYLNKVFTNDDHIFNLIHKQQVLGDKINHCISANLLNDRLLKIEEIMN